VAGSIVIVPALLHIIFSLAVFALPNFPSATTPTGICENKGKERRKANADKAKRLLMFVIMLSL
jgi:hypothetical protein